MAGMIVIISPSFSSYCPCRTSGTGQLYLFFVLCFSSYVALSRFAVLWFALPAVGHTLLLPAVCSALVLPAVGFALLPAVGCALLGSFHRCSRSSMFFSLSSSPCCFTSFYSPQALWLWFLLCFFFRVTLWLVTTPWLVSGVLQQHHSALRPS